MSSRAFSGHGARQQSHWELPIPVLNKREKKPAIEIPKELAEVVKHGLKDFKGITPLQKSVNASLSELLNEKLSKSNYKALLTFLLYAEQLEEKRQLQELTIRKGRLFRKSSNGPVMLIVTGLMDKNPNIMKGDIIIAHTSKEEFYRLEVKDVDNVLVSFKHNKKFLNEHFNYHRLRKAPDSRHQIEARIQFTVNEGTFKSMHRALALLEPRQLRSIFPPASAHGLRKQREWSEVTCLDFANQSIANNPEQSEFVSTRLTDRPTQCKCTYTQQYHCVPPPLLFQD